MRWSNTLFALMLLCACEPELSKEQAELLDAMLFTATGLEDNSRETYGLTPWIREVKGRSIELHLLSKNGFGFSDPEDNEKTKNSRYARRVRRISAPKLCVFRFESLTEFSKGDSLTDFSVFRFEDTFESNYFDLTNAYHFDIDTDVFDRATVFMQGPSVACLIVGGCQNYWRSDQFAARDEDDSAMKSTELIRRQRAIEFIKKTCPGKPY